MNRPFGIIFDLGDTILKLESFDTLAGSKRLLEFAENASHLTAEDIKRAADEVWEGIMKAQDESMIQAVWRNLYRLVFETVGVSFKMSYAELEKEYWLAACQFTPADGICEVLDTLDKYKITTGIVSNTSFTGAILKEELAKHNLADRFTFLVSSADYGLRKPHNRIFELAVRMMNLKPHDIWFVGDKLEYDIKGAINSGLYPVWYNCKNEPGKNEYQYLEVKDWHEFKDKIESLCSC